MTTKMITRNQNTLTVDRALAFLDQLVDAADAQIDTDLLPQSDPSPAYWAERAFDTFARAVDLSGYLPSHDTEI